MKEQRHSPPHLATNKKEKGREREGGERGRGERQTADRLEKEHNKLQTHEDLGAA